MAFYSFDQAEALERRNDETVAASGSAQVPDQGTGEPQECRACSPGKLHTPSVDPVAVIFSVTREGVFHTKSQRAVDSAESS